MSTLNLVPVPQVLLVQGAVFAANFFIIKKLFVEPYLTVRDRRERLTIGSKGDATKAITEAEVLTTKIAAALSNAADAAKKDKETIRAQAITRRQTIVGAAEAEAKTAVAAVEKDVQRVFAVERAKIPAVVQALTQEVYQLALK